MMVNRYRRAARRVSELGLGTLDTLDEAIPEERGRVRETPAGLATALEGEEADSEEIV
ncbi:MAG TPA: hypothetical protein RMH85_16915 [Polyangiaceae bacterium LLY-WYZ-15_(1-7)]|nr:hypothetical protein [Polyangiaceae bacterium LLY-WYZ-15_(1-7)]HJL06002.1 hypothetical protein [Polyangiaceae bacterium LLY-WYZ-15_(1-7)]HJL10183.1 hypothetical protein [Polyangiaceae bacterium LLY-WYZ-15_(1-7)]HJL25225.1 hypothetical protein [Polyangiaceae bacterium LLY-WYZ-15_(1-7)]HJL28352.1 hypothetical protein [Polyangiaceae bacterium LLY-WYZ-15_(1-7)]